MTGIGAMTNQAHNYIPGVAARIPARHEGGTGTGEAEMRQANPFKELAKSLPCNAGHGESPSSTLSDKLLEQGHNLWTGPKLSRGVLLSFCERPDAKPFEIDLARYMQVGLAKPRTLFPRNLKAGTYPIRLVGERFHNLPMLSLSEAWLTWRGFHCQAQTEVDSGEAIRRRLILME